MGISENIKREYKLPYKLEQHLMEVCNNSTYDNLLSSWKISKKICSEALSTVAISYPHYTKHDASHCEAILTNIEMLLGEDAIRSLTPTDTWLLLQSAYLHDIGMVIEYKKIEKSWDSKEFQDYLHEMEDSNDDSLAQNARLICSLGEIFEKKEEISALPVKVRYAVTILISEYYRKRHAEDSKSYIEEMQRTFDIDLSFNGLVQKRLIMLLADIVYLHTESSEKILELDYRTNGFNADYAHPRFLAQMLRMGDLLDADNNRFNHANKIVLGDMPDTSRNHVNKHMSARHILITPDIIEYRADCSSFEVYRETRNFILWLKEEVEFWALNWKKIMPEVILGSAPRLGKCELLLDGVPDIQGISNLRFSISPEKAFEVIEGCNIYEDHLVFLREVIQNALDACKVQLWRDISEEKYRSWIHNNEYEKIQPYEIDNEVFKNYRVEVKLLREDEKHLKIIIRDNGTGISVEQLKKICSVGESYSKDKKRKKEIDDMPLWLRPTAGFGIGLQSVFLVADEFEIHSKSSSDDGIYARVASRRKNGYVQINRLNELRKQGTEIHIIIPDELNFKYTVGGKLYNFIEESYDPFMEKESLLNYKIWDVLRENIVSTYFPIELHFNGNLVDTIEPDEFEKLNKVSSDSRYKFKYVGNYGIELWDNETCTKMRIDLMKEYRDYGKRCFFKGMEIENLYLRRPKGISYIVDFYGLDTKKTLALDRKRIRKEAMDEINSIIDSAIEFFKNIIEEKLFKNQENHAGGYNEIYTYWCIVPLEKKIGLLEKHTQIFEKIKENIAVLVKTSGDYINEEIDFKDIFEDLENVAIINNIDSYTEYIQFKDTVNEESIKKILNENDITFSKIIIDKNFTEMMGINRFNKLKIVSCEDKMLKLTSFSKENRQFPESCDKETTNCLLRSLLKKKSDHTSYKDSIRKYMICIDKYKKLCTKRVPFGIDGDGRNNSGYIISPVTTLQWESLEKLNLNDFVENVCSKEEFSRLVDYVYENQFELGRYTKEEITENYKSFIMDMYKINK